MRIGSLFSGIGGLEMGLEMSGLGRTVWQVEQNEFCREVLAKHWPHVERFEDVKEVGARDLREVDLICGGFPCQDISSAGKGEGLSGKRSGLWFEFARIIEEVAPAYVVVENVASGAKRWVDQVSSHLGELGYEVLPVPLSAMDVGAPHLRKRIFLIAYSKRNQLRLQQGRGGRTSGKREAQLTVSGQDGQAAYTNGDSKSTQSQHVEASGVPQPTGHGGWHGGPTVSPVCGVDDGIPGRTHRLKALGNSVVPQCAEVVGWVVRELAGL